MALKLETLTEEILTRIISFVTSQSSLYSVALVSRTLNRLATSYLYEAVNFNGASSDTGVKYLIPFSFLAFEKPYTASLVRSFSIRDAYGLPSDSGELCRLDELDANDEDSRRGWPSRPDRDQIIRSAIKGIGYTGEEVDEWLALLLAGNDESAILAILLPHLKKLCRLDLNGDWLDSDDHLVSTMRKVSQGEKPFDKGDTFSALTDVLVAGNDDKYPTSPIMLGACLGLPSLRRIHALNMGQNEQEEATELLADLQEGGSSVEEIELRGSKLYSEDLEHILSAPKALRTFIYEVGQAWAWYPVDTNDIHEGLSRHKESLESIVLDHPDFFEEQEDDNLEPMVFRDFTNLEYLKVSNLFLGGTDDHDTCSLLKAFPKSLNRLCITYCNESGHCQKVMPALLKVLRSKKRYLPNLEALTLEGQFNDHPEYLESVKDIVLCATGKGVTVEVADDAYRRGYEGTSERGWGIHETVEWQEVYSNKVGERQILQIEV